LGVPQVDGSLLCSAQPLTRKISVADRPYFQRAITSRDFSVGQFQFDRAAGVASVNFAFPVVSPVNNEVVAAAVAVVSLDWWSLRLAEYELIDGTVARVSDPSGKVIARYPPDPREMGVSVADLGLNAVLASDSQEGVIHQKNSAGGRDLVVFKPLLESNGSPVATMSLTVPLDKIYGAANHQMWVNIALLLSGVMACLVLASVGVRRLVTRPLANLLEATDRLANGQFVAATDVSGTGELAELARRFNRMAFLRQGVETQLRESEVNLAITLHSIGDAVITTDTSGRITRMNPAAERLTAWPIADALGRPLDEVFVIIDALTRQPSINPARLVMERQEVVGLASNTALLSRDGREYQISDSAAPIRDDVSAIVGVVIVFSDVTQRKQAEASLHLAASVFSHARDGIMITDANGSIIDVNEAFTRITGYTHDEALGCNPSILKSARQDALFYETMWRTLKEQGHWSGEIWNRRKDNREYVELLTISSVQDVLGNTQQYVCHFSDISDIKEHQSKLEHIAHFDALTGLPNRTLLSDRLQQAMAQAQRREQQVAVAYLDLDGFKAINDRHGHAAGDQVLICLAHRMKEVLRDGDTISRIGGDEFVAVLIDLQDSSSSTPLLNRLLAVAALPVQVGELSLQVSASLGVTLYPQVYEVEADQLLRQADQAMYQAKLAGKNRYHVFDAAQDSSLRVHHESLERIRQALAQREFTLHYQPKVNMRSGVVIGAEALIRWQHPEKGLLAPAMFLPVIEDHPLEVDVGEWVIDTALSQIERWHAAGLELPVSVNISASQLQQADFVKHLQASLARHPNVRPNCIELEVLETSALADMAQVSQVIEDCAKMGVEFSLDDFGTGYSSLTYLKQLQVAQLKIDQSFVRGMLDDPDDLAIVQVVISLAAAFKREVIAEGVETVAHGTALLELGCALAQGYGIARPMPAEKMPAWAATWKPDAAWCSLPDSRDA
jgi:diguanylate cyclase (GGDEF)-like protein/PAS domain S-box-containing protein